ncbi:MAG TPA: xanthine dehydrogenase family protein subunit M [Candidatus Binataceae bacterium]|nr:xanthine dehydrogenase family protein subunit M [Candidatus Binataceae bacterium]
MHAINYEAPKTIDEAVKLLAAHGEKARPLCGGTDLLIQLRAGVRRPEFVVDIKEIREMRRIEFSLQHGLRLGAAVPCIEIHENADMRKYYPGLTEAAHLIGSLQIQSRASVGGNLCNGSPAADTTPALIALGAKGRVIGPKGERLVAVEDFCTAPGRTVLDPGELLVEFQIPVPARNSSDAYLRFIPRNEMDIAVVGVGAAVTLEPSEDRISLARVALGAVGPTPIFAREASQALTGKHADNETIERAAQLAITASSPIDDMRGTAEFRRHVVGVLTRRAVAKAIERARAAQQNR